MLRLIEATVGILRRRDKNMKSKTAQYTITATKRVNLGQMPFFVQLAHKGLEKSKPEPLSSFDKTSSYLIPKDILKIGLTNQTLIDDVESVEFTYSE